MDVTGRGGGRTVFVSTHYMEEAEYCGRLALMNRGRLIAVESPESLRGSMAEPILEIETDDAPRAVAALHGAPGVLEAAMFGRALHVVVRDEAVAASTIPSILSSAGRTCGAIRRVAPSLEDVFVSRVRRAKLIVFM